jgi:hypothetical protein
MVEKSVEAIEHIANPWSDGRPSVLQLIAEARDARGSDRRSLDIDPPPRLGRTSVVPGGIDNIFGFPDLSTRQSSARPVVDAIAYVIRQPSERAMQQLYALLCECRAKSIVDLVIETLYAELGEHACAIAAVARRLVRQAPDVEPVKVGVALLGISGTTEDSVLISTVGLYEEITAYSALAIARLSGESAETEIWKLAKSVHGWGRINAVQYLTETMVPEIKEWMLREGFRNHVLDEYLAYTCATAGGLEQALRRPAVDPDLLAASADLLTALAKGGPAEGIADYADGPMVCVSFLRHMRDRPLRTLRAVECVLAIQSLLEGDHWAQLRDRHGWTTKLQRQVQSQASEMLQQMNARHVVEDGLRSEDRLDFYLAAALAPHFGIDPWPQRLERQRKHGSAGEWYFLMQIDRRDRIDQVLELARTQLNFEVIGSGPTMSMGLGQEFEDDTALGIVIQGLNKVPGVGWDLLRTGLRSRVCGVRNATIRVLGEWKREAWPADAVDELRRAAEREPDEEIRHRMEDLMSGGPRGSDTL